MLENVKITTLDNGCRIVTSSLPGIESIAIGIFAGVGSRFETPAQAGHSHFLEHMLFKGSEKRSARAISQDIESRGGNTNAYTNFETTVYYASVPAAAASIAMDVLGDIYIAPKLSKTDVDKERFVILEELNMYHDQPDSFAMDLSQRALWTNHPLGSEIIGNTVSLAETTRESLFEYHNTRYNAGATVIAAAGKLDHDSFVKLASSYANRLPSGPSVKFKPALDKTRKTQLLVDRRETEQVNAVIGFRAFGNRDPRRYSMNILNVILGGNMSSRLFQSVREKHGLAYSIGSTPAFYSDTGAFQIIAGLDRGRSVKGLALCAAELSKIANKPVGKAEFNRAVDYLVGSLQIGLETARSHMSWIGGGTLRNQYQTPNEIIAKIKQVTPGNVQDIARELFHPQNATLALVMPRQDVGEPEEHLAALLSGLA